MKTLIGHNNPPRDRKIKWKSVSLNIFDYKDLQFIAENILHKKNCFRLLEGKAPLEKISIPYAISLLITDRLTAISRFEIQDNGRNIWEQTAKKLLRNYNTKQGNKKK